MEAERADERTFTVSFPWRDFSLNYLLNGLQGQDFSMRRCVCVCVCQHLCVLACYGTLQGIFLHFTHAFPPQGMWHCRGKKNWIKVILSVCSSSPESLPSRLYTHTHTLRSLPLLLSVSPVHQWVVMFGVWPQSRGSQDAMGAAKSVSAREVLLSPCLSTFSTRSELANDSALPLSTASVIGAIFAKNKRIHCETRQINSDWSTCIKISLSSKINMFDVLKLRDIFSLMFFVENTDNHAFACSDNVRII